MDSYAEELMEAIWEEDADYSILMDELQQEFGYILFEDADGFDNENWISK